MVSAVEEYDERTVRSGYTREEQEKQAMRLTRIPPKPQIRDPFPLCPTKTLPQSTIDKTTERLYTFSIQKREMNMAELDDRTYRTITPASTKMSESEVEESVKRLYDDAVLRKQNNLDELKQKYLYHPSPAKRIDPKTVVQHMYHDRIEAKKKTEEKLYKKYIVPTDIHLGVIPRSRAKEAADRLCTR